MVITGMIYFFCVASLKKLRGSPLNVCFSGKTGIYPTDQIPTY